MADYKEAFQKGIDEAIKIQAAKKEVAAVFQDFKRQLEQLSGKKLHVELAESSSKTAILDRVLQQQNALFAEKERPQEFDIAVRNPQNPKSPHTIGRWQPALFGYPVRVSWQDEDRLCNDKQSLEIALADLIANPAVAEKLLIIMNDKDPPPASTRQVTIEPNKQPRDKPK